MNVAKIAENIGIMRSNEWVLLKIGIHAKAAQSE